jgi:hypothetical protein
MHATFVRLIGAVAALVPPALLGYQLWLQSDKRNGEGTSTLIALLLLTCMVSIPGGYVAVKGVRATPPPGFRLRCVVQIALGAGMLVVWLVVMVLGNFFAWLLGVMFIWYGILGIAAVNMSLGVFSLISNRELLREMSEINLFGTSGSAP